MRSHVFALPMAAAIFALPTVVTSAVPRALAATIIGTMHGWPGRRHQHAGLGVKHIRWPRRKLGYKPILEGSSLLIFRTTRSLISLASSRMW